jgi:hypothetical protein
LYFKDDETHNCFDGFGYNKEKGQLIECETCSSENQQYVETVAVSEQPCLFCNGRKIHLLKQIDNETGDIIYIREDCDQCGGTGRTYQSVQTEALQVYE